MTNTWTHSSTNSRSKLWFNEYSRCYVTPKIEYRTWLTDALLTLLFSVTIFSIHPHPVTHPHKPSPRASWGHLCQNDMLFTFPMFISLFSSSMSSICCQLLSAIILLRTLNFVTWTRMLHLRSNTSGRKYEGINRKAENRKRKGWQKLKKNVLQFKGRKHR